MHRRHTPGLVKFINNLANLNSTFDFWLGSCYTLCRAAPYTCAWPAHLQDTVSCCGPINLLPEGRFWISFVHPNWTWVCRARSILLRSIFLSTLQFSKSASKSGDGNPKGAL